jgi:hypothetical protein
MKLSTKLPQDDTDATLMRFDHVRRERYTEIFLIAPADTGELVGAIYNTIGLNSASSPGDTSPQALLDKVDRRPPTSTASPARSRTARDCGAWTGSRSWWAVSATSTG